MVLYPIIYVILTLPLAAGRMAAMAGRKLPITYYCVAGALLTSCGWLDTLLYTLTRRVFIKPEGNPTGHSARGRQGSASTIAYGKGSRRGSDGRRWHGRKGSKGSINAMPSPANDPNWPLSTFASVSIEVPANDQDISSTSSGVGNRSGSRAGSARGIHRLALSGGLYRNRHTPSPSFSNSRSRTPTETFLNPASPAGGPLDIMDDPPPSYQFPPHDHSTTQTIILADHAASQHGHKGSADSEEVALIPDNGIRSETTIEVVSVSRSDMAREAAGKRSRSR
jgi:hypothetical protein